MLFLHGMETLLTAVRALLHTGLVVERHQFPYGLVEFYERMEHTVPQFGIDAIVHVPHPILYERFLCGFLRVARQHDEVVVVAHVLKCLVQLGLVPVVAYHG